MSENLGERLYVHSAFEGAGGKRMPQGMKAFVRNIQFFQEQFKTSLVGADGNRLFVCRHHEARMALFLYAFEERQQLSRQWDHAAGSSRFRLANDKPAFAVMTGLGNGQNALYKVNIAPLQGNEFTYAQAAVKTEKNAVQLIFPAA